MAESFPSRGEQDLARVFLERAIDQLCRGYPRRIRQCLERLSEEDIWWQPNPACNSVGNLVLHICGNVGQRIGSSLGGNPDTRDRPREFAERGGWSKDELGAQLEATMGEAQRVLESLSPRSLLEERTVRDVELRVLAVISLVVEHTAYHVGQIVSLTKIRTAEELPASFFRVAEPDPDKTAD